MRKKQNNVNNKNVVKQRTVDCDDGDVLGNYDIVIQRDISLKRNYHFELMLYVPYRKEKQLIDNDGSFHTIFHKKKVIFSNKTRF